ncbi:MAG: hypothetical protein Greene041619_1102 [Candidatus Peregrinibacteria bacterium Greene0416_19]|nr:MAG: hypothetical protein Greene041619_1102 [Candidatus Peregrinibacteria bacterium Greene0416_19]
MPLRDTVRAVNDRLCQEAADHENFLKDPRAFLEQDIPFVVPGRQSGPGAVNRALPRNMPLGLKIENLREAFGYHVATALLRYAIHIVLHGEPKDVHDLRERTAAFLRSPEAFDEAEKIWHNTVRQYRAQYVTSLREVFQYAHQLLQTTIDAVTADDCRERDSGAHAEP